MLPNTPQIPAATLPEVPQASETPAQSDTPPKYLTQDEFDKRMADYDRRVQSQLDKRTSSLDKRFNERLAQHTAAIDAMVNSGVMTAEQATDAKKKLPQAVFSEVSQAQPVQSEQSHVNGDGPSPQEIAINVAAENIAVAYGLAEGDPELSVINLNGSPQEYIASVLKAGQAKQARLAQQVPARSPAMGVTGGTPAKTNPIENINSTNDLYNMAYAKEKARR